MPCVSILPVANQFLPVTSRWLACKYAVTIHILSLLGFTCFVGSCWPEAGFFFVSLQSKEGPEGPPGEMGRPGLQVRDGLHSQLYMEMMNLNM